MEKPFVGEVGAVRHGRSDRAGATSSLEVERDAKRLTHALHLRRREGADSIA